MQRLNQLLAIEQGVKTRRETELTKLHQDVQKDELLSGLSKTYQPKDENGDHQPQQNKKVQIRAEEVLVKAHEILRDLFDVTAKKDATNCIAKADVKVDNKVLLSGVPATHLLFLLKKLDALGSFFKKLPVLSSDENWVLDDAQKHWKTEPVETISTKKLEEHLVIVQPTKEHPAQTVKTVKDVPVGTWKTVKFSGALPKGRVDEFVERIDKLSRAVKTALEEANQTTVAETMSDDPLLDYLFK